MLALMLQKGFFCVFGEKIGASPEAMDILLFTINRGFFETWLCKARINNRFCMAYFILF